MEQHSTSSGTTQTGPMREEQQLRVWIKTVLKNAALEWVRNQRRQRGEYWSWEPWDEEKYECRHEHIASDAFWWYQDCLARLTPRDRWVLQGIHQGWRPIELAHRVPCDPRTIRRSLQRIRRLCPYE